MNLCSCVHACRFDPVKPVPPALVPPLPKATAFVGRRRFLRNLRSLGSAIFTPPAGGTELENGPAHAGLWLQAFGKCRRHRDRAVRIDREHLLDAEPGGEIGPGLRAGDE